MHHVETAYTTYQSHETALEWFQGILVNQVTASVGGMVLFISDMLMIYSVIHLALFAPKSQDTEFPIGDISDDARETPKTLEYWKLWIGIAILLILFAYTIPLINMIQHAPPGSPPFRTW